MWDPRALGPTAPHRESGEGEKREFGGELKSGVIAHSASRCGLNLAPWGYRTALMNTKAAKPRGQKQKSV